MAVTFRRRLSSFFTPRKGAGFAAGSAGKPGPDVPYIVTVEYCGQCYYKPFVNILEKQLEDVSGIKVHATSTKVVGAFEVTVHTGGPAILVWSKLDRGLPVHEGSAVKVAEHVREEVRRIVKCGPQASNPSLPHLDYSIAQAMLDRLRIKQTLTMCEP